MGWGTTLWGRGEWTRELLFPGGLWSGLLPDEEVRWTVRGSRPLARPKWGEASAAVENGEDGLTKLWDE